MPANKFKFHLFTGSDPDTQYSSVATKDAYTFYLLANGKGYLGTQLLFDNTGDTGVGCVMLNSAGTYTTFLPGKMYAITTDNVKIGSSDNPASPIGIYYASSASTLTDITLASFTSAMTNYIANNVVHSDDASLDADFEGADDELMTSAAVATLIDAVLSETSIIQSAFFRTVELHTLTAQEITDGVIHIGVGDQAGDTGLLFTRDNDMTDDASGDADQEQFFINLKQYITIYTVGNTNSIHMSLDQNDNNKITADLNVKTGENSIIVDSNGVSLNKTNSINDGDGTTDPETGAVNTQASADKLVTEADLVSYIQNQVMTAVNDAITAALANVVTWAETAGSSGGSGDSGSGGSGT